MPRDQVLPPAICIMGPTASGKTGLALELLQHFPGKIISVDSALVYRDMNIGTAKPNPDELRHAPHRLINLRDPTEVYSAAEFRRDALHEMHHITAGGHIPLLAGGTMLYFRALLEGIAELPEADEPVRERIAQRAANSSWQVLHNELAIIDPESAQRIHPNDLQRIQRALEVYEISGITLSQHFANARKAAELSRPQYRFYKIALIPENRAWLRERIAQRFNEMLRAGLVEEVKQLKQQYSLDATMPSMRSVGYRQIWQYLQGDMDVATMREKAITATRQLAKRQLTWLRSEQHVHIYDPQFLDIDCVIEDIRGFLHYL